VGSFVGRAGREAQRRTDAAVETRSEELNRQVSEQQARDQCDQADRERYPEHRPVVEPLLVVDPLRKLFLRVAGL
jgi:hypothetical protein